jgi:branched-chain amino acid transport system substrate-binding protein
MMKRDRHVLLRGAAVLGLVAAVGACSSSGHSSSSPTTAVSSGSSASSSATGAAGAQSAAAPIKVGVICSCSGAFGAQLLAEEEVYKAWANTVNSTGGIDGHNLQIIAEDDGAVPGTSVSDLQTLLSEKVDAIADISLVDSAWAAAVESANVPVVGTNLTQEAFYTNPDFYPQGETFDHQVDQNAEVAKAAGATNVAEFYCAESATCQQGVPLFKAAAAKYGLPLAYSASISATAPNYTAQCVAAQQAHVSSILIADGATQIVRVGQDCSQQGYHPIYVSEGPGFGNTLTTAAGIKDSLWTGFNVTPYFANTPAMTAMNAAVDKYYPGLRQNSTVWSESAAQAWPGGQLLEDAVKGGGLTSSATPSSAEIIQGLGSLKGDTLQGMSPPLTFAPGKPHSIDCWFTGRVQNGVPSLVDNGKLTCSSSTT